MCITFLKVAAVIIVTTGQVCRTLGHEDQDHAPPSFPATTGNPANPESNTTTAPVVWRC